MRLLTRAILRRLALTHIHSMQASRARRTWREAQGAVSISLAECDVKVDDARLERPKISLTRLNTEASPSQTLVSEMMIMAGQIAAKYGEAFLPETPPEPSALHTACGILPSVGIHQPALFKFHAPCAGTAHCRLFPLDVGFRLP